MLTEAHIEAAIADLTISGARLPSPLKMIIGDDDDLTWASPRWAERAICQWQKALGRLTPDQLQAAVDGWVAKASGWVTPRKLLDLAHETRTSSDVLGSCRFDICGGHGTTSIYAPLRQPTGPRRLQALTVLCPCGNVPSGLAGRLPTLRERLGAWLLPVVQDLHLSLCDGRIHRYMIYNEQVKLAGRLGFDTTASPLVDVPAHWTPDRRPESMAAVSVIAGGGR